MRKRILITGASSGLGKQMAIEFAAHGRDLVLCARRLDNLQQLQQQLKQINPNIKVLIQQLDVDDHQAVFSAFERAAEQFGGLDRIIINAGIGKGASIGTGQFDANKATAMTNFVAALAQTEAAMQIFRRQNSGHLVTISSVSAARGFRRALTVYGATKAALTSMTEGLAVEMLGTPIKVSCIHPGFIRTEINAKVEKVPFIVDLETGGKALFSAIEQERRHSYVPSWPWSVVYRLLKFVPLSVLRKFS